MPSFRHLLDAKHVGIAVMVMNAVVLAGRDAIPAEVLGDHPDAVFTGLLRMVDHYAPSSRACLKVSPSG